LDNQVFVVVDKGNLDKVLVEEDRVLVEVVDNLDM
jgi:hypothetical protein